MIAFLRVSILFARYIRNGHEQFTKLLVAHGSDAVGVGLHINHSACTSKRGICWLSAQCFADAAPAVDVVAFIPFGSYSISPLAAPAAASSV